jgi:CheY-like chemotaxis protein
VLVVDDNTRAVEGLCALLELDGFEPMGVASSVAALGLIERQSFFAVITDLEMPEVHGLELIRAGLACSPAPLVFVVTGYVGSPAAEAAKRFGARQVLAKPLAYEKLAAALLEEAGRK